jgi:hypothetical protein
MGGEEHNGAFGGKEKALVLLNLRRVSLRWPLIRACVFRKLHIDGSLCRYVSVAVEMQNQR